MRIVTADELAAILAKHRDWLIGREGGSRAVLSDAVLSGAVLSRAVLSDAVLSGAVLSGAVLSRADLSGAVLSDAVLSDAVLSGAVLSRADLSGAVLSGAVLSRADLSGAVLDDKTILEYGDTFKDYKEKIIPALCTAGGKSLVEVAGAWDCHDWTNCPMATAFSVHKEADCPPLLLPRVREFVRLFDARLLPRPVAAQEASAT